MFRWDLMLRNRFGVRGQQSETRRAKQTVKLHLEELPERILLSASPMPVVSEASPQVAAATSFVASMMDQRGELIATIEQDLSSIWNVADQEIAQAMNSLQQQLDNFLGITPSNLNPSQGAAGSQFGSSLTATDQNAPKPSTNDPMPPTGNSGST